MNNADIVIAELKREIEELQTQRRQVEQEREALERRLVAISEHVNALSGALHYYQEKHFQTPASAPSLDIGPIKSARSQIDALIMLAEANGGRVSVSDAWSYLLAAGLMRPVGRRKAYVNTYSILDRSKRFQRIGPGLFEFIDQGTSVVRPLFGTKAQ